MRTTFEACSRRRHVPAEAVAIATCKRCLSWQAVVLTLVAEYTADGSASSFISQVDDGWRAHHQSVLVTTAVAGRTCGACPTDRSPGSFPIAHRLRESASLALTDTQISDGRKLVPHSLPTAPLLPHRHEAKQ